MRGGRHVPEDRLRAAQIGALLVVPLSLILFSLGTGYLNGSIGFLTTLLALLLNGIGVCIPLPFILSHLPILS